MRHQTILDPALGIGANACFDLVAVVGAVVHALHGERQRSSLIALIEQSADLTHGKNGMQASRQVGFVKRIVLLRYGERNHLQRRGAEYLKKTLPVSGLRIGFQRFGNGGYHLLFHRTCRLQAYEQRQVVVGLVDDLIVESLGDDYSTVILAGIQHVLQYGCRKRAEDVSSTEVDPCWSIMRLLPHSGNIKLRKLIAFLLPFFWIEFV